MGIIVFALLVWLIILQCQINDISFQLKLLQKSDCIEHTEDIVTTPPKFDNIPNEVPNNDTAIPETKNNFEKIFLGNLFNKIGACAILIGVVIFLKLLTEYIIFTPALKITLSYFASAVLCLSALYIHKNEKMKNYAEVLLGTGFGALFITTYCAKALFNLFSLSNTCIIATLLLLGAFYTAHRMKTVSMLAISLFAGYLNPYFINHEPEFVIWYLIFVNILSLTFTFINNNRSIINIVNIVLTALTALIYCSGTEFYPYCILWGVYFIHNLMLNLQNKTANNTLSYINFILVSIMAIIHLSAKNITILEFILSAVYLIPYIKNKKFGITYLNIAIAAFNTAIIYLTQNHLYYRLLIWALESIALSIVSHIYKIKECAAWAIGIWTSAFTAMLFIKNIFVPQDITTFKPIYNIRLFTFTPLILSAAISSDILSKSTYQKLSNIFKFSYVSLIYLYLGIESNNIINKNFIGKNTSTFFVNSMLDSILGFIYTINLKHLHKITQFTLFSFLSAFIGITSLLYLYITGSNYTPIDAYIPLINIRAIAHLAAILVMAFYAKQTKNEIFKYMSILAGFILLNIEVSDLLLKLNISDSVYIYSIGWVLYAGIITILGIFRNKKYLKYSGITICILSIVKIFIYDLEGVSTLFRLTAFLVLGVVLLTLSYLYNKISPKE